jgi:predicted O-methyltransferase YrrM
LKQLSYLYAFLAHDNPLTDKLQQEAVGRDDIQPFVEMEAARLISLLIRLTGAKKVLELGTGIAYSTIWLGEAVRETGGSLISVDNHLRTGVEAAENIRSAGLGGVVELISGNAEEVVPAMAGVAPGSFDLIFQDCGKYLYPLLYENIYLLLKPGGLLITDDTLFSVTEGIRKGLGRYTDDYNAKLFSDPRYYSTLLPVGHGLAVSLKQGREQGGRQG